MISRRKFLGIAQALGLASTLPYVNACSQKHSIRGELVGANVKLGHRLRKMNFDPPVETLKKDIVIIGGGVAGLSAARYLKKYHSDFVLLELEGLLGGNAIGGCNSISGFPWGAHYLPLPNNSDPELISFLEETGVITGVEKGLPIFNEYYLCHDPKERLFINNLWQEGIVPHEGVPIEDRKEINRFLALMKQFKEKFGNDGRPAFTIPLDDSSKDEKLMELDLITAKEFLDQNNFKSSYLEWYVNYCCADDFGTSIQQTSAWAMIHYFASRKGKAYNAFSDSVLTWPEGNHWLIKRLEKNLTANIVCHSLVYQIKMNEGGVECFYFDAAANVSKSVQAKAIILATPQFINQRLLGESIRKIDYNKFDYAPWMVANITTNHSLNDKRGETVSWDNVIYGSTSLGYVNATHQLLGFQKPKKVITYYKPLLLNDTSAARKEAYQKSFDDWKIEILNDLKTPHTDIEKEIEEMKVWIWGHAMIRPGRGFIWSENRINASKPIDNKIFFAHSDLSGISIFEEAFYRGHRAAKEILNQ